jgi:sugar phosphate isomerase/epimerase
VGKIILEFDSIEDAEDARTALDGSRWKIAMWDLDQELRKIVKYGQFDGREATSEEVEGADKLRQKLREILEDYNLNLD